jgi:hypothetical protein
VRREAVHPPCPPPTVAASPARVRQAPRGARAAHPRRQSCRRGGDEDLRERLDLMLAPVIVRILAGATRRFRRVGATPRHAPSVHVNEGRCLRACPRPGDGPCQLRKRRSRGRWIGPEACRAGPKPLARPRDDKADQRSEEPYAASRTSGTAAAPRTTSRHQHWKPDEPRRRRPSASARRSHITQPSDDGYLRSCTPCPSAPFPGADARAGAPRIGLVNRPARARRPRRAQ